MYYFNNETPTIRSMSKVCPLYYFRWNSYSYCGCCEDVSGEFEDGIVEA